MDVTIEGCWMQRNIFTRWLIATLLLSGLMAPWVQAAESTILTLTAPGGFSKEYGRIELESLPQGVFETVSPWTKGKHGYRGPLLRELIRQVRPNADRVNVVALNNYSHEVRLSDYDDYALILAMSEDGRALTRRNKGPLWLLVPFSDHPKLSEDPNVQASMVWQIVRLEVLD
jgi:hypothetical protein